MWWWGPTPRFAAHRSLSGQRDPVQHRQFLLRRQPESVGQGHRSLPSSLCPAPARTARGRCPISPCCISSVSNNNRHPPPPPPRMGRPALLGWFSSWTLPGLRRRAAGSPGAAPLPPEPTLRCRTPSPLPDGSGVESANTQPNWKNKTQKRPHSRLFCSVSSSLNR